MEDPNTRPRAISPGLAIADIGLRTRVRNALLNAGVTTVGELVALVREGDAALSNIEGIGPSSIAQIKTQLTKLDLMAAEPSASSQAPSTSMMTEQAASQAKPAVSGVEKEPVGVPPVTAPNAKPSGLSLGERLQATLAAGGSRLGVVTLGILGVALFVAALFLPPASLLERVGLLGYTVLSAESSSLSHPDGITIGVDPATFTDRVRIKLGSIPRLELLEGSAGSDLHRAVEALPDDLIVESPYYVIQTRGKHPGPFTIEVAVPNDSEPWRTLDLYTWTGETWEWLGADLDAGTAEHEVIRAHVTELPQSVVVVQSTATGPQVSTYVDPGDNPVSSMVNAIDEINPTGLLLGTMGDFAGSVDTGLLVVDSAAGLRTLPTLRNWAPGASVNSGLVGEMLTIPELQKDHIGNIVQFCVDNGVAGIELDYRGLESEERDSYASFVETLADAMHGKGLTLSVVLPSPLLESGVWNTQGYDWKRIGAVADIVKVPFPADPTQYGQGGTAEQMVTWAAGQVSRLKLRMLISSLSSEIAGENARAISLEEALAPVGQVTALSDVTQVEPGSELPGIQGGGWTNLHRVAGHRHGPERETPISTGISPGRRGSSGPTESRQR